jgi:hypothetical protein
MPPALYLGFIRRASDDSSRAGDSAFVLALLSVTYMILVLVRFERSKTIGNSRWYGERQHTASPAGESVNGF